MPLKNPVIFRKCYFILFIIFSLIIHIDFNCRLMPENHPRGVYFALKILQKRTIQIDEELIIPKKCKKMCDDEIECKYFFIQYNPAEGVTTCETFKTCDVAVLTRSRPKEDNVSMARSDCGHSRV